MCDDAEGAGIQTMRVEPPEGRSLPARLSITPLFFWNELGLEEVQGSHCLTLIVSAAFLGGFVVGPIIDWLGIRPSLLVALTVSLVAATVVAVAALVPGILGRKYSARSCSRPRCASWHCRSPARPST